MSAVTSEASSPTGLGARVPFYHGWIVVGLAALAMVGTLPGRTQGLGLVTEPLLKDFGLSRVGFAEMNLWATLLGSLFCLGFGRLLDRFGSRFVVTSVSVALSAVVLGMSASKTIPVLFALLVLSRGFGQSALSVASIAMVGQWFRRRLNLAMATYSLLLSVGFMIAFPLVGAAVIRFGWRSAWATIGGALLLGLAPMVWLFDRRFPSRIDPEFNDQSTRPTANHSDFTWIEALRTPTFWIFAVASSTYNLIASGIGLFNESILAERGFPAEIYHQSLAITALTSLAGNFLGGWLTSKWKEHRLMTLAMALLAVALATLPSLTSIPQVYAFATVIGVAGGFVMVIFFSYWASAFGRTHLGRIQGTAQMLTVLASAVGPLLLAECRAIAGTYSAIFYSLAVLTGILGTIAWFAPRPEKHAL